MSKLPRCAIYLFAALALTTTQAQERTLVLSAFGVSQPELRKELYAPFEAKCKCKIVVNIGNSEEISIHDLAERIIQSTNSKSKIVYVAYEDAYKPGFEDMERRVPNIERIKELTGWAPTRNLDTIIRDMVKYLSNS